MIDYSFAVDMFKRYSKHLQDVVTSIETMIGNYDKQIAELEKLPAAKYGNRLKEVEGKRTEAYKKLAQICPNIEKMYEQMNEIQSAIPTREEIESSLV